MLIVADSTISWFREGITLETRKNIFQSYGFFKNTYHSQSLEIFHHQASNVGPNQPRGIGEATSTMFVKTLILHLGMEERES